MRGQNALRPPKMASRAGSSVSMVIMATAMPMAAIGPRPEVPLTLAKLRHRSARMTVQPEARIGTPARRSATRRASRFSTWRRSSSR